MGDLYPLRDTFVKLFGFDHNESIRTNHCVPTPTGCGQEVDPRVVGPLWNRPATPGFRNKVSLEEYKITGLCQKCQDKMFEGRTNDDAA